ncbi:MAG: hypothetical protein IT347_03015 [Candidatus Eisenbacteria bacterium]|nr:hypothetical protein [Candidatus Eisenbacteria bacterium]
MRSLVWKLVLAALTLALVASPMPGTSTAWAAAPALEEAQALYDGANFADAITKLRQSLASGGLAGRDAIAARALMARCLVKSGKRLEAKQAFKFVLRQEPGWRPDASVGPDEVEVFELAQKELTAEQIEAGKRIPASLSFSFGSGNGDNKDMAEIAVPGGGKDKYSVKPQIGGSVRFPVAQKWSLELELQRLRATNRDSNAPPNDTRFELTAYPLSLSVYYTAYTQRWVRANLFAGGGLLSSAISKIEFGDFGGTPLTVSGQKNGTYFHGGLEAELLVHPRVAIAGRVMGRAARAEKVLDEFDFDAYGVATLKNRSIDFSGFSATLGLRAYIGY